MTALCAEIMRGHGRSVHFRYTSLCIKGGRGIMGENENRQTYEAGRRMSGEKNSGAGRPAYDRDGSRVQPSAGRTAARTAADGAKNGGVRPAVPVNRQRGAASGMRTGAAGQRTENRVQNRIQTEGDASGNGRNPGQAVRRPAAAAGANATARGGQPYRTGSRPAAPQTRTNGTGTRRAPAGANSANTVRTGASRNGTAVNAANRTGSAAGRTEANGRAQASGAQGRGYAAAHRTGTGHAQAGEAYRRTPAAQRGQSGAAHRTNAPYGGDEGGSGKRAAMIIGGVLLLAVIAGGSAFAVKTLRNSAQAIETTLASEAETETTTAFDPNVIQTDLFLDYSAISPEKTVPLLNMKGMDKEQVAKELKSAYQWALTVKNANPNLSSFEMPVITAKSSETETAADGEGDNGGTAQEVKVDDPYAGVTIQASKDSFAVPDLIADSIDSYVDQIFADYEKKAGAASVSSSSADEKMETGDSSALDASGASDGSGEASSSAQQADYVLAAPDVSAQLADYAKQLALVWNAKPKNGDIVSYDAENDKFKFGGAVKGYSIDADQLAAALEDAVASGNYSASVDTPGTSTEPSSDSTTSKYKTIGSFTTKTTSNQVRNKNIALACQAINGHVMQPGDSFSFNDVVGERTAAKGYGAAAAYSNGEVVQEVGGGVCQVSTTLYNAVFRAGLTTTSRRSHTFEPSYVTPGLDATVSWGGPDYKFVNSSGHAIGIRASYSNQTCTISIYGIPVLPEGVTWELSSTKVKSDIEPPTSIINSGTPSAGSYGSEWQVYKVVKKNGEEVERTKDHYSAYRGHTKTVLNPAATTTAAPETTTSAAATTAPTHTSPTETSPSETPAVNPAGPGETATTAAPHPTTAAHTTAPEPTEAATAASPGAAGPGEDVPVISEEP